MNMARRVQLNLFEVRGNATIPPSNLPLEALKPLMRTLLLQLIVAQKPTVSVPSSVDEACHE